MPASGDGGGDVERCVVGSGRVAPEAGPESSEPPQAASATESGITASRARVTAAPDCFLDGQRRAARIECVRAEDGSQTTLHAELGNKWALVMAGPMVRDGCAAVVARRVGEDSMITLAADHDYIGEVMLVRPDAHLGWLGRAGPDALDRWLTAVVRQGRAG